MNCQHCRAAEAAIHWDSDGDAWCCMICGWRDYLPAAGEYPDCNLQFSVNCGSIVRELTHGRIGVRTWVDKSRVRSLWHAHQGKVANEIVYHTHQNSFDYGYKKYEELKHQRYIGNGYQQRLWNQDVRVTDQSSGSVGGKNGGK